MMRSLFIMLAAVLCCTSTYARQAPDTIDKALVVGWFQDQQYEQAVQYLQGRVRPDNVAEQSLLGYALYQWGQWPATIRTYRQVLQLDSLYIPAHQYLATIYLQQDNPLQAIPHCKKLVALQPLQSRYYRQLSFACFAARQPDSGFHYLQQAYALNPMDSKVVARLGEEWLDREQYPAADSVLRAYLDKDSLQTSVIIPAIKAAYYLKDYPRAIALGQHLIHRQVISVTACSYVAAACYYTKRYQECIHVHDFLKEVDMTTETITYYAAMAYAQLKDYGCSNELLQQCIDRARSKSLDDYYTAMGSNYEELHQYKKATACLDTAWYLFQNPLRQYSIGRIYDHHLHQPLTARRYYQRYLRLAARREEDPAISKYVRERLGEMEKRK
ncbi:tetratricopeptide repeat protein [Chitinophaga japonensis]|nr:hypothetical protein [Chitinophaga japonensis]